MRNEHGLKALQCVIEVESVLEILVLLVRRSGHVHDKRWSLRP